MSRTLDLAVRAQGGDIVAFEQLVGLTQTMAYAVARGVLPDRASAEDAVQTAYLHAYRSLGSLQDPAAFAGWFRRIVVTTALNSRRRRRTTLLRLEDAAAVPILDEQETYWSEAQRHQLASALLTLTPDERRLCDRRYHGRWSVTRLASATGVDDATMRKRLQRLRDKLRREIEMSEQRAISPGELRGDLPSHIVELLARPRLTDIPENPVGQVTDLLRSVFAECSETDLPEIVNLTEALATPASDAIYVDATELHRIDEHRILRYDLTLPLLMTVRAGGQGMRIWATGKAYRLGRVDATHLEAFHQAEVFLLEDRSTHNPWSLTGRVLQAIDLVLPGRSVRIVPTEYGMCRQAWELSVDVDGVWSEVMAWGVFTDAIVKHIGGDPRLQAAVGIGYGLERVAMIRFGIDDIRKVDVASVA